MYNVYIVHSEVKLLSKLNIRPVSRKRTTKEIVYNELKDAILNGHLKKDTVFTETQLAESLNTSRTPVREAVSDLMKDGLLVSVPRRGIKIREITENEKEQISFLRLAIETEGVTKLSQSITQEQVEELHQIVKEQIEAMEENDRVSYIELDLTFHRTILHFANLMLLEEILQDLYNLTRLIGHKALMKEGRMKEVIQEHFDIIKALEENNSNEARNNITVHLFKTRDIVNVVDKE